MWESRDDIRIDPDVSSFLTDHEVDGAPLLPTALQVGLLAAAARRAADRPTALRLAGLSVEQPVRFVGGAVRTLTVRADHPSGGAAGGMRLVSEQGACHLRVRLTAVVASMGPGPTLSSADLPHTNADLPGTADLVYPPMFHGPAFQVIGRFGRVGSTLVARLAPALPGWPVPGLGDGRAAQLVELLLQACGVWELAQTGRMMRPARIDELVVAAEASEPQAAVWAWVQPIDDAAAGGFDGVVLDGAGRVLIRVAGYHPVELGTPPSCEVVGRLSAAIGRPPAAYDVSHLTYPTTDQGATP